MNVEETRHNCAFGRGLKRPSASYCLLTDFLIRTNSIGDGETFFLLAVQASYILLHLITCLRNVCDL